MRLEDDYLEARTLKYVVVMECLCNKMPAQGVRIPKSQWRDAGKVFLPKIVDYLSTTHQTNTVIAEQICNANNWGNLNRVSFRALLAECLEQLDITPDDAAERIRIFTEIRNSIVHDFNYLTPEDLDECGGPTMDSPKQHFWVANFVDEVILRLFGLGAHVPHRRLDRKK